MSETAINIDIEELNERINKESAFIDLLMLEMNKVIVGQKHMTERLLIGLSVFHWATIIWKNGT